MHEDEEYCPNCGEEDRMLFPEPDGDMFYFRWLKCYECGLCIFPETFYMDLEDLNINRKYVFDLPELKVLPKHVINCFDDIYHYEMEGFRSITGHKRNRSSN